MRSRCKQASIPRERALNGSRGAAAALVIGGIGSVQIGAAFATELFDDVGPGGAVFLRIAFAAIVLVAIFRPSLAIGDAKRDVVLLGLALAGMNLTFYESLDRIPLGIAVTLEFVGPLGVAIAGSHRRLDLVWVGLAIAGILLLSPLPGSGLDAFGCLMALIAGAFWAAYILLTARVGAALPGASGLAIAMAIAAVVTIPAGLIEGGSDLLGGDVLLFGFAVALLSSAIPYSLEMEALRRLPAGTFGVLMSLEPGVAATVGFVGLGQDLAAREVAAIALVVAASIGAVSAARRDSPEPFEAPNNAR